MIYLYKTNEVITVGEDTNVPITYYGRGGKSGKFYPSGSDNVLLVIGGDYYTINWADLIVEDVSPYSQASAMSLLEQFFSGLPVQLPLILIWDDIANVPVANPSDVADWNAFFSTVITPFTSVVVTGNTVTLYGGVGVTLTDQFNTNANIIKILDYSGSIIGAATIFTFNSLNLTDLYLPAFIATVQLLMFGISPNSLKNIYIPSVTYIDPSINLSWCTSLESLDISGCTNLGGSVFDDGVFNYTNLLTGLNITLTVPSALMTCNGGLPDGDIQWLQANNNVTIIEV
jgi:hypothetical protein